MRESDKNSAISALRALERQVLFMTQAEPDLDSSEARECVQTIARETEFLVLAMSKIHNLRMNVRDLGCLEGMFDDVKGEKE